MKCFIDVETTGLNYKKNKVVEIALIIDNDNDETIDKYQSYIKHLDCPDSEKAFKINKLSKEFLDSNGNDEKKVVNDVLLFLDKYKEVKLNIIGHCVKFDVDFLISLIGAYNYSRIFSGIMIDTRMISIELVKRKYFYFNDYKLETLCNYFKIKYNFHSAMPDAMAARELYYKLSRLFN